MTTHNKHNTTEYRAWSRMKTACYNKNNPSYKTYGARGIEVQEEWRKSFSAFYKDMGAAPKGCTGIELIDLDKDFCRLNCRWTNRDKRRPLADMPNQKKRVNYKLYKNPKRISITLEQGYYEFIQRQAIERSRREGKPITASDLMKEVIEQQIPMPKQQKMKFKEKK